MTASVLHRTFLTWSAAFLTLAKSAFSQSLPPLVPQVELQPLSSQTRRSHPRDNLGFSSVFQCSFLPKSITRFYRSNTIKNQIPTGQSLFNFALTTN